MIYIVCPTDVATGGTEVLHQLHAELSNQGFESSMVYIGKYEGSPVQKKFAHYDPLIKDKVEDYENNALIVPETCIDYAFKYHRMKIAIWWLSVNNYQGVTTPEKKSDILRKIKRTLYNSVVMKLDKKWLHLVQSEYARQYVNSVHHIDEKNILSLSDYLSDEHFIDKEYGKREDIVLYNPKKGYLYTKKIINACPELQWAELINLTSEQMKQKMRTSKVYIDFGSHPGKDRIPREAAIAGCCIITGKMGSSENNVDVPIPDKFKFDQLDKNIPQIVDAINYCIANYAEVNKQFDDYRKKIRMEKKIFVNEVHEVGKRLLLNPNSFV